MKQHANYSWFWRCRSGALGACFYFLAAFIITASPAAAADRGNMLASSGGSASASSSTGSSTGSSAGSSTGAASSVKRMQRQLEDLQRRLEELDAEVNANTQAVEATAQELESGSRGSVFDRMSIGGYGELHYNNLDADDSEYDKDEIDFHRFVLFFGYQFTDDLHFFSEFELEHSLAGGGDDAPGEVELEQAFVEYSFDDSNAARVGVFLLPLGILNETHEPPTFYGVERNSVEAVIIPSTWWAGGIGYTYRNISGLQFDLAFHEGLEVPFVEATRNDDGVLTGYAGGRIRSGRQKTAEAVAEDFAMTGRLRYTGVPGLELALALQYQEDITQDGGDALEEAVLYEVHAIYNRGPFGLRALYARWDISTDEDALLGGEGDAAAIDGANDYLDDIDAQDGWYIEPSYKVTDNFGVFVRYEDVDGARLQDRFDQWTLGANYWVHDNVVLKMDIVDREHDENSEEGRDFDGFNLGFGYHF